jgi:hypothetical protein
MRSGFALKSLQRNGLSDQIVRQELQGNVAVQLEVFGLIHHTHPATAEFFDDAVVRDGGADHEPSLSAVAAEVNGNTWPSTPHLAIVRRY